MHMCSASGPSLAARTSAREVHACKVHAHKVTSPPEVFFFTDLVGFYLFYNRNQAFGTTDYEAAKADEIYAACVALKEDDILRCVSATYNQAFVMPIEFTEVLGINPYRKGYRSLSNNGIRHTLRDLEPGDMKALCNLQLTRRNYEIL